MIFMLKKVYNIGIYLCFVTLSEYHKWSLSPINFYYACFRKLNKLISGDITANAAGSSMRPSLDVGHPAEFN